MPYLKNKRNRQEIERYPRSTEDSAELNYLICWLLDDYVGRKELSYDTITAIRGALTGASEEFERVIAGPYEEVKRQRNGDVWERAARKLAEARAPSPEIQRAMRQGTIAGTGRFSQQVIDSL